MDVKFLPENILAQLIFQISGRSIISHFDEDKLPDRMYLNIHDILRWELDIILNKINNILNFHWRSDMM